MKKVIFLLAFVLSSTYSLTAGDRDKDLEKKIVGQWQFLSAAYSGATDTYSRLEKAVFENETREINDQNKSAVMDFTSDNTFSFSPDPKSYRYTIKGDTLTSYSKPTPPVFVVSIKKDTLFLKENLVESKDDYPSLFVSLTVKFLRKK